MNGLKSGSLNLTISNDVEAFINQFSRVLGICVNFLDTNGKVLSKPRQAPGNTYCMLIRKELGLTESCYACDKKNWTKADASEDPVHYVCHGGLMDGSMAIRQNGRTIGYMMLGRIRLKNSSIPMSIKKAWAKKYGNDELERAYNKIPAYSESQLRDIMGLFKTIVDVFSLQQKIKIREVKPLETLLKKIEENPTGKISIQQAAATLNCSKSYISHLFNDLFGVGFIHYQNEARIDYAENLIKRGKAATIKEASAAAGFDDQYYFSRLYRKHRGHSPSKLLRKD